MPAGEFLAYCIVHEAVLGGVFVFTFIEWYAENVGFVKIDWTGFALGEGYELTDAVVIGTETLSWGQVKASYR